MKSGVIISYAEERGFGFIKGNNKKKYFFHINNFKTKPKTIEDGMMVEFTELPTEKGYTAKNITILETPKEERGEIKYVMPDDIYISKQNDVKSWDTLQRSNWIVKSSSKDLEEAKEDIKDFAELLGGNALVNFRYNKTTESTSGTGGGTYYYSMHHYSGEVVTIGKKSRQGEYSLDNLEDINHRAETYWRLGEEKNKKSFRNGVIGLIIIVLIALYSYYFKFPHFDAGFLTNLFQNSIEPEKRNWIWSGVILFFLGAINQGLFFNKYNDWLEPINGLKYKE